MNKAFGSKDLLKCVKKLGFTYLRTSSSHEIYAPPQGKRNPQGRSLPIQVGKKSYDPHSRARYISEIKNYGFTKEEIESAFKK
jgi:hypothetical protein